MVKVYVKKEIICPVSSSKVKDSLKKLFLSEQIVSEATVSLSFVGEAKMMQLANTHLKESNTVHSVLSFPFLEDKDFFANPPGNDIHLGDIVICYPEVVRLARKEDKLIDEVAIDLAEHGALHLLGKHHD